MMTMIKCEVVKVADKFGLVVEGEKRTDWGVFDTEAEAVSFLKGWIGGCGYASDALAELVEKDKQESAQASAAAVLQATTLRIERDMLRKALDAVLAPDATSAVIEQARALLAAQPRAH